MESLGRPFKAIVVVLMTGGADTFNLLVPHSNCPSEDLFAEYESAREVFGTKRRKLGSSFWPKNTFHTINIDQTDQPCKTFGIHHKLPYLKTLFDTKQLSFLANMGFLIEPFDSVTDYKKEAQTDSQRCW